jgi:hypothetical protein
MTASTVTYANTSKEIAILTSVRKDETFKNMFNSAGTVVESLERGGKYLASTMKREQVTANLRLVSDF